MPIYEYKCASCGKVSEVMQKMSDPAPANCPACHEGPLSKIMSRTAFQLKGEGWYVTDFRDKKKPEPKAEPAKAAASGEASASAPADAKAAASTEKSPASDAKASESSAKTETPKPSSSTANN